MLKVTSDRLTNMNLDTFHFIKPFQKKSEKIPNFPKKKSNKYYFGSFLIEKSKKTKGEQGVKEGELNKTIILPGMNLQNLIQK